MKRTPMPLRKTPMPRVAMSKTSQHPLRRTELRPVSRKRRQQTATYTQLRRKFLTERQRCEFPNGCDQPATTVQHLRGRRGERLNDQAWWAASCWPHNEWAETHTGEALAIGWLYRIEAVV